ncbi:MAG: 3-hydroxyacyl-CoA dehydrogenase family protein [Bacteroidota bacterium]|nr:3-hydroxyacyl-CoA dehydrogenase family protein [Bacteroidota bacterium]
MKILAIGSEERLAELRRKISPAHECRYEVTDHSETDHSGYDVIFDLEYDDLIDYTEIYDSFTGVLIIGAVKESLAEKVLIHGQGGVFKLIGINSLPTFINRPKAEISLYRDEKHEETRELFREMGWEDAIIVKDRVGMVSPRILFQIINEACYTLQEGTASAEDIDSSMKLGTNYPYGPFEWGDRIGVKHVYETLETMYEDTHDERFKPCPLLKDKYLRRERLLV